LLASTMRHEFLHALVEHEAGPAAPLWLREGLVEAWGGEDVMRGTHAPAMSLKSVDDALARSADEAEAETAHRAAGEYAVQLLAQYGRPTVLGWLRSGVPSSAVATLGQR
jgi:hypothetical protein